MPYGADESRVEWLEAWGSPDWRMRKVNETVEGYAAEGAVHLDDPPRAGPVGCMDEAFSGGARPVNSQVLEGHVLELRSRGKDILFSTHIMEQAERCATMSASIARGQKLVDGHAGPTSADAWREASASSTRWTRGDADRIFADRRLVAKADASGQSPSSSWRPGGTRRRSSRL